MRPRRALEDLVGELALEGWLPAEVEALRCGCRVEPETRVLVAPCLHVDHEALWGVPVVRVETVETGGRT